jgi:hypothetical protein
VLDPREAGGGSDQPAALDLLGDKSPRGCPRPVRGRAYLLADGRIVAIPCGLNRCPWCRRVNVMVTAAMLGADALISPPRLVITTTTRDWWIDDGTLREGTRQFARTIRHDIAPRFEYAWL